MEYTPEEYFKIADEAIFALEGKHLRDPEKLIIEGSVEGKTYKEIAEDHGYAESTFKRDYGQKLWERMSEALGERVSKTNFRTALQRYGQRQNIPPVQRTASQSESGNQEMNSYRNTSRGAIMIIVECNVYEDPQKIINIFRREGFDSVELMEVRKINH